jgi:hypothetical protein
MEISSVYDYVKNHILVNRRPSKLAFPANSNSSAAFSVIPERQRFSVDSVSLLYVVLLAALFIIHFVFGARPAAVGDELVFEAGKMALQAENLVVPARVITEASDSPGRSCSLDVTVMTAADGRMNVLALRRDGVLLSWTGQRTAAGEMNCGPNEQILVSDSNYERLSTTQAPLR